MEKDANNLNNKIEKIITNIYKYRRSNYTLLDIINRLEQNKQNTLNRYLAIIKNRDLNESKLQIIEESKKKIIRNKIKGFANLTPPIKGFISYKKHKKGVQFKYRGTKPITAPEKGKISYAGNLAAYGNVIIIDHGKQTRSIILGNFVPKLEKGTFVKRGELLGYTTGSRANYEQLYFEVRRKSKVQNTLLLMDRTLLKNNNL
jgi:murein DD-endopeptidase MepM/ murein hydrolase activator NlpD